MKRFYSTVESRDFWDSRKNIDLENAYSRIAPGIPFVNAIQKDLFIQKCKEYYVRFSSEVSSLSNLNERWDEFEIVRMFGKGLNPTSLKTTYNNIEYFVKNLKVNENTVRILEFGPGSGWSTIMLYNKLKESYSNKKIELVSVDLSLYSIVATQNSLDYMQIPWQTELRDIGLEEVDDKEKYITLILSDFTKFCKDQKADYFDGFFSSHGTAYLSEEEYTDLLKLLIEKGKEESIFVCDSLDPLYTVDLSSSHLLLCSFLPAVAKNSEEYVYGHNRRSNSKYFPGMEVKKLIKVNNEESMLFYNWNNYLIKKFKIGYLIKMLESIKITTDVIEEYREDVFPSYLIEKILKEKELTNNFKLLKDLPKSPLYLSNCGLRIIKK